MDNIRKLTPAKAGEALRFFHEKIPPITLLVLFGTFAASHAILGCAAPSDSTQSPQTISQSPAELFKMLHQEEQRDKRFMGQPETFPNSSPSTPKPPLAQRSLHLAEFPESEFLLATGHGDLSKGGLICERVSDTVARMELAKQIRVLVKEHAMDRVREQTGKPFEQDIEIMREEITNELLQGVKIIHRTVDKDTGTCSSTAVMPKNRIVPQSFMSPTAEPKTP